MTRIGSMAAQARWGSHMTAALLLLLGLPASALSQVDLRDRSPTDIALAVPTTACPGRGFYVSWNASSARTTDTIELRQRLAPANSAPLHRCYLDGSQERPPAATGSRLALTIKAAGDYAVRFAGGGGGATASVVLHARHCYGVAVTPATSCAYDRLAVRWQLPAGKGGAGDRVGIFRAGAAAGGEALQWLDAAAPTREATVRLALSGTFEVRYHFAKAPDVADETSAPFAVLPLRDASCGTLVAGANPAADPPAPARTEPAFRGLALGNGSDAEPGGPDTKVLAGVLAFEPSRSMVIPRGALPALGRGRAMAVVMSVLLLQDSTGAYRLLFFKGSGTSARTPSMSLLPNSRRLTFQVTSTRADEDCGISQALLPLCKWTHIAFVINGPVLSLFINGALDKLQRVNGNVVFNDGPLQWGAMGTHKGPAAMYTNVSILSRVPSDAELRQMAQATAEMRPLGDGLCPALIVPTGASPGSDDDARFQLGTDFMAGVVRKVLPPKALPAPSDKPGDASIRLAPEEPLAASNVTNRTEAVTPDPAKAFAQFSRASAAHAPAMLAAGELALFGAEGLVANASQAAGYLLSALAGIGAANQEQRKAAARAAFDLAVLTNGGIGVPRDPERAVDLYRLAATGGSIEALLALGHDATHAEGQCIAAAYYYRWAARQAHTDIHNGIAVHVEKTRLTRDFVTPSAVQKGNRGESDELIQFHIDQSNAGTQQAASGLPATSRQTQSMREIGDLYFYGARGIKQNHATAASYFERAADAGDRGAVAQLAAMRMKGQGADVNDTGAVALFNRSATEYDDAAGHNGMAFMYFHGRGVPQNYTLALHAFEAASKQGSADAAFNTGLMYQEGKGTLANNTVAERYFKKAAALGHFDGIYSLGQMYLYGHRDAPNNGTVSCALARHYLRMAAEHGTWGSALKKGLQAHIAGNFEAAANHYEQAAAMGYHVAKDNAAFLYDTLLSQEPAAANHTLRLLEDAVKRSGSRAGSLRLGDLMYYIGNFTRALELYRFASLGGKAGGLAQATTAIGYFYEHGEGSLEQDHELARHWYRKAVQQGSAVESGLASAALAKLELKMYYGNHLPWREAAQEWQAHLLALGCVAVACAAGCRQFT